MRAIAQTRVYYCVMLPTIERTAIQTAGRADMISLLKTYALMDYKQLNGAADKGFDKMWDSAFAAHPVEAIAVVRSPLRKAPE